MIFTWFDNPPLRPRLQTIQAREFHYPNLPILQMFTIDFQGVNERLSTNLFTQVFPTLIHSQIWWENKDYNKNSLLEWTYKL